MLNKIKNALINHFFYDHYNYVKRSPELQCFAENNKVELTIGNLKVNIEEKHGKVLYDMLGAILYDNTFNNPHVKIDCLENTICNLDNQIDELVDEVEYLKEKLAEYENPYK